MEKAETIAVMRRAAKQIRDRNICGWGNVIDEGIACIEAIEAERARYKALAGELAEVLRCVGDVEICWCIMPPVEGEQHTAACKRATAVLAKYKQETKGERV